MVEKNCNTCWFKELKDASTSKCWDCRRNPVGGLESGYSTDRWVTDSNEFWKDKEVKALEVQVGGSHYSDKTIQPIEYIFANKLGFCEGNVVKYITRWRDKGGKADLEKVKHYVDLLIELEKL